MFVFAMAKYRGVKSRGLGKPGQVLDVIKRALLYRPYREAVQSDEINQFSNCSVGKSSWSLRLSLKYVVDQNVKKRCVELCDDGHIRC